MQAIRPMSSATARAPCGPEADAAEAWRRQAASRRVPIPPRQGIAASGDSCRRRRPVMGPDARRGGQGASPRPPPPVPHAPCDVLVGGRPRGRRRKPAQTRRRQGPTQHDQPVRGHWIGDDSRVRGRGTPPYLGIPWPRHMTCRRAHDPMQLRRRGSAAAEWRKRRPRVVRSSRSPKQQTKKQNKELARKSRT